MKTILLLKERKSSDYLIDAVVPIWSRMGYKVVNHQGTRNLPQADIVFLHIDRTVVPSEYLESVKGFRVVVNRRIVDISRKRYSTALLHQDDSYKGPVIVKTNANYGRQPERRSEVRQQHAVSDFFVRTLGRLQKKKLDYSDSGEPWEIRTSLNPLRYPIFETFDEIPTGVWRNPNLVVEKFLPEREGDLFFVRYWSFLGDKDFSGRLGSRNPIVKFGNIATPDKSVPIPDELRILRKKMGLDYGRIDFVVHEGIPYVLDVNKTLGRGRALGAYQEQLEILAAGIACYG
jgi:hypothetical protein